MYRRLAGFLFLAVFIPCAIPCKSQLRPPASGNVSRTFYVRGSVRNADDGHALEMVKVDLKRLTGELVGSTFTRSNGDFEFSGIPNGVYYVIVEEKNYDPIRESVEVINSSRSGVYIFLKHPFETTASAPGSTVSVREMSIPRKAHDAMQKGLNRLYEKQDYKGSLVHFQRAVAEFPSYYEAYHQMGVAYMRLGQAAEAEQAFRKSIELSENRYATAYLDLAALLSNNQRFAEAEPLARRGLDVDSNAWYGHLELARALLGLNHLDAAEKSALEARTRKADYAPLHLLLANIHIRKRDYPALLHDLDAYLQLEPNGPMSDQARQTRDKIQRLLANAQTAPAAPPPKP